MSPKSKAKGWVANKAREQFKVQDVNQSGSLNVAEFEIAILRLYDTINRKFPLPVELQPPSKQKIMELLKKYDLSEDGKLDEDEFVKYSVDLISGGGSFFNGLVWRLTLGIGLKLLIWPLLAGYLKAGLVAIEGLDALNIKESLISHVLEIIGKKTIVNSKVWNN